jgi:RNA polymerase sigma-70 factor (ECF subfamily)
MDEPSLITDELLGRAREGDENANDRLVELLYPQISGTVRNHIRRAADREDVIQEIFMKMFLKLDQYRGPSPFEHWLSRLAVTTCYDWLRKYRARPLQSYSELSEAEAGIVERTLSGSLAEDSIPERDLLDGLLDKLLARLKPREQIVIRLLDLEERSVKEVQEVTGWSASRIKTAAMRARRKLAESLRRLEGPANPEP